MAGEQPTSRPQRLAADHQIRRLSGGFGNPPGADGGMTSVTRGQEAMLAWYERIQARLRIPYESIEVTTRFVKTHLIEAG